MYIYVTYIFAPIYMLKYGYFYYIFYYLCDLCKNNVLLFMNLVWLFSSLFVHRYISVYLYTLL